MLQSLCCFIVHYLSIEIPHVYKIRVLDLDKRYYSSVSQVVTYQTCAKLITANTTFCLLKVISFLKYNYEKPIIALFKNSHCTFTPSMTALSTIFAIFYYIKYVTWKTFYLFDFILFTENEQKILQLCTFQVMG